MNLTALQAELSARGYDHITDPRKLIYLNDAMHALCEEGGYQWPFLEATATGTAPLTISDVRTVLFVTDTTNDNPLTPIDIRTLSESDATGSTTFTPTTSGNPESYWLDGLTTLRVYPANTSAAIAVKYLKVPSDLASGSDTPVLPTRYHSLIVDVAQAMISAKDSSDPTTEAEVQKVVDRAVGRMASALLDRAADFEQQQILRSVNV